MMRPMGFHVPHAGDSLPGYRPVPRTYAWAIFSILVSLMIVDYIDRQVVVSMFSHIKDEWMLSDRQLGALVSIVSVTVAAGALPLSLLADRWGRVRSIFLMALVWSLATIACAFAASYYQLLAARAVVGLGEAAYGTVGVALLAALFPPRMRSTVLGAFLAAGMLGSVLGVVLGGFIAERWGWQAGFGAVGVPGLVLAVLFAAVARNDRLSGAPLRGAAEPRSGLGVGAVAAEILASRTLLVACVGAGLQLLAVSTVYAWLPSYLVRFYGLAPDRAGLLAGLVVLAGGVGAVAWSIAADRLSVRNRLARFFVPITAAMLTALLVMPALWFIPPGALQFGLLVVGGLAMAGTIGPVAAVVVDVSRPEVRATASAVLSVTQNLIGLAGGPIVTGALSDRFGLQAAMGAMPLFCIAAAALFLLASRTYERDLQRVADPTAAARPALHAQGA